MTDSGSNERGTFLRKTELDTVYNLQAVDDEFSGLIYDENTELVDVYCGKSAATAAVASALAAMCALLAM